MVNYILIAIYGVALAFGLTRAGIVFAPGILPEGHILETYKALAHVFTGACFGAYGINFDTARRDELPWKCLLIGVALSAVELACFVVDFFV